MLTEREKLICWRLREFRELTQIPRTKFALGIGITGERMASYETGRARVPYGVARQIVLRFWMSEVWLAEGIGESTLILDTGPERPEIIPDGMPFSEAYDTFLKRLLDEQSKSLKGAMLADRLSGIKFPRTGLGVNDAIRKKLLRDVIFEIQNTPGIALPDFEKGWNSLSASIKRKHAVYYKK
jgi:hypothetical protein